MIEDGIFLIQLKGCRELFTRVLIIFEFIIDDSESIVDWRELGVMPDEFLKALESVLIEQLPLIKQPQVVETVDIFRLDLQSAQIVPFLFLNHVHLLVAHCTVVVQFIVFYDNQQIVLGFIRIASL
jgi:hypothetical protein